MSIESTPFGGQAAASAMGPGSTYESRQADFCLNRCQYRALYEREAQQKSDFSDQDCAQSIELGQTANVFKGAQDRCGMAILAIALAAKGGEF